MFFFQLANCRLDKLDWITIVGTRTEGQKHVNFWTNLYKLPKGPHREGPEFFVCQNGGGDIFSPREGCSSFFKHVKRKKFHYLLLGLPFIFLLFFSMLPCRKAEQCSYAWFSHRWTWRCGSIQEVTSPAWLHVLRKWREHSRIWLVGKCIIIMRNWWWRNLKVEGLTSGIRIMGNNLCGVGGVVNVVNIGYVIILWNVLQSPLKESIHLRQMQVLKIYVDQWKSKGVGHTHSMECGEHLLLFIWPPQFSALGSTKVCILSFGGDCEEVNMAKRHK